MKRRIAAWLLLISFSIPILTGFAAPPNQPATLMAGQPYPLAAKLAMTAAHPITWSLTKDGVPVGIPAYIQGNLSDTGGIISFKQEGSFTLTASVTDMTGRTFSKSATVLVYTDPALNCDFSFQSNEQHVSKNFTVVMDAAANTGDKNITWSLTKDGSGKSYTGSLTNNGGSIKVSEPGTYTLKASITDSKGNTSTCSKDFTAKNTAPNTPTITRTPNTSPVNYSDQIRITASASDPDGDAVSYIWVNRPNEYSTYAPGNHTMQVAAKDSWGAVSGYAQITFTSAVLYESGTFTKLYPSVSKQVNAKSGYSFKSVGMDVPAFTMRGGYSYLLVCEYYDTISQAWIRREMTPFAEGTSYGRGFSGLNVTSVKFGFETNDPNLNNMVIAYDASYT